MFGYVNLKITVSQADMFLTFIKEDLYRCAENLKLSLELQRLIDEERKNIAAIILEQLKE